jgi:hypothetical protein
VPCTLVIERVTAGLSTFHCFQFVKNISSEIRELRSDQCEI